MKFVSTILGLCITAPIWFYLLYQMLARVGASELMWFLYWIYVPSFILVQVISKAIAEDK